MAHADNDFDDQLRLSLAKHIGVMLTSMPGRGSRAPGPVELRESFALWALGLDAIRYGAAQNLPIARLARPLGRHHHQITAGGQAFAFARSTVAAGKPDRARLAELFVSPLAPQIDKAIDWIDQRAPGDPLVRMLAVPAFYLHAMWLIYPDAKSRVLIADVAGAAWGSFSNILNGLGAEQFYEDRAFLRALAKAAPASGVLPGGQVP